MLASLIELETKVGNKIEFDALRRDIMGLKFDIYDKYGDHALDVFGKIK